MSKSTYRKLAPKDAARIKCNATVDQRNNSCGAPATTCETCHWDTGNTKGISFFYFCDAHSKQETK